MSGAGARVSSSQASSPMPNVNEVRIPSPTSAFDVVTTESSRPKKRQRLESLPLVELVKSKNIKLAIFDKDGTLIEFHNYWCQWAKSVVNSLLDLYASLPAKDKKPILRSRPDLEQATYQCLGCDPITGKVNDQTGALCKGDMVIIKSVVREFFKDYVNISDEQLVTHFDESFAKAMDDIEPYIQELGGQGNIRDLFTQLNEAGCRTAIFTSDVHLAAEKAIDKMNISEFVRPKNALGEVVSEHDLLLCSDSDSSLGRRFEKPSGGGVRFLASQLGLREDQVLMVGDSKTDILSAHQAGCSSLFVSTGLFDYDYLLRNNIIPTFQADLVTGSIQDAVVEVSSEVTAVASSSGAFAFASTASSSDSSSEASSFRAAAKNGRFHKSRAKPIPGPDGRNLKSDGWNLI